MMEVITTRSLQIESSGGASARWCRAATIRACIIGTRRTQESGRTPVPIRYDGQRAAVDEAGSTSSFTAGPPEECPLRR